MDNLREKDIVATRFWDDFLRQSYNNSDTQKTNTYLEALVCLYVHEISHRAPNGSDLVEGLRQARMLELEPYSDISSDSQILGWLHASDPTEFRARMNCVFLVVRTALTRDKGDEFLVAQNDEKSAVRRFEFVFRWLQSRDETFIVPTFDLGLTRLAGSTVDVAREAFCARLAAELLPRGSRTLVDMFGVTGQFPIQASQALSDDIRVLTTARIDRLGLALEMRFHMGSIQHEGLESSSGARGLFHWPYHHVDLALINPSSTPARRDEMYSLMGGRPWERPPSALSYAYDAISTQAPFELMLVIVPQVDGRSVRWQLNARRELVNQGFLVAVIDLPQSASDQKRARFSAWLIQRERRSSSSHDGKILFIDAEPLARLTFSDSGKAVAAFIGQLVTMCTDNIAFKRLPFEPSGKGEHLLQSIFAREFSSGYRDVPGLCQLENVHAIADKEYKLVAHEYLQSVYETDFLARVDRAKLNSCLDEPVVTGKRIYVIGNNGEGKSLLLRDIAQQTAVEKRKVVAISFGAIDRFPRSLKGDGANYYTYMGARTSVAGINIRDTAISAGRLMLDIHMNPEKKEIFDEIAQLTGFESEQYLIPISIGKNAHADGGLIGGIVRLNAYEPMDQQHVAALQQSREESRKYKLGLKRKLDHGSITPFDELSSGEQQIVILAAKMVLHANTSTLFLIDEPEISLHVSWQRAIPKIFTTIGRRFRADVLVATHSPILISGALEIDDYCFALRDGTVQPLDQESRRSVETALFEGFRTYTTNNREVHERCASLVAEFIDVANRDHVPEDVERDVLGRLGEMRRIIEDGKSFDSRDTAETDIDLIEKARAAITEIRNIQASRN
ncbi:AAA family ATPase [Paraburkholderia bryophila]|uniref:Putative AbiEii toxin of type IV toxin-antitoxin system n=1 Tax=Paraburkholderia bryophila TaxID=420952 RepID=A0A329BVJ8_9BURK|nr:AAA family ATPase [Paraburkholderia bryophila]RAS25887.1 putative AbiEii toxin of type IV toxin-antitoxin system [Paraburkholderia bryophila]